MASEWFYQAMGRQIGPVSAAHLRNLAQRGTIAADTPVRKAPDGTWVVAERVRGLFPESDKTPPPMPAAAMTQKQPDSSNARVEATDAVPVAALSKRRLFIGISAATAIVGCVLVVLGTRNQSAHAPVANAQSTPGSQIGTLEVRGTILKVRPWSAVLYLAEGKGEDPTDSFIRQADAIKSAVKETERLAHVVERDMDAVNAVACEMKRLEAGDGKKWDALWSDHEEKQKQRDRDSKQFDDWSKHVNKMAEEMETIKSRCQVYKARTTLAPIRFLYKASSGWKDAVPGAGMGNDLYVPVSGKPQALQITIGNPDVCSFAKNDRGEYCLVPVARGKTVLSVALGDQKLDIPIEVVVLPCKYGDSADQVIGKLGVPDNREVIGGVERWTYDRWPKAVLIISSNKTLFTVKTVAASQKDGEPP